MGGLCAKRMEEPPLAAPSTLGVEEALKQYYKRKVLPVELRHDYHQFYFSQLSDAEFVAKPSVLFVGQYSVGKTSMISYLLNVPSFPGSSVGPEPTTDGFVFIGKGEADRILLGASLVHEASFPFKSIERFGPGFLGKLKGSFMNSPLLEHLSFVDTPGILSGEKQRVTRGYDFHAVVEYLAEKVDLILLLFDTSKLDISDEFKLVLQRLQGNEEKIKIILNKADAVESSQLIRVRGALMWNLGKILNAPEVPKVTIGSFWNEPLRNEALREAFQEDYISLLHDLQELPKSVNVRKINDMVKRAKQAKIHALIMNELALSKSWWTSWEKAKDKLTQDHKMIKIYFKLKMRHSLTDADFCTPAEFRERMKRSSEKARKMDKKLMEALESFIENDVSLILGALPVEDKIPTATVTALQRSLAGLQMPTRPSDEESKIKDSRGIPLPSELFRIQGTGVEGSPGNEAPASGVPTQGTDMEGSKEVTGEVVSMTGHPGGTPEGNPNPAPSAPIDEVTDASQLINPGAKSTALSVDLNNTLKIPAQKVEVSNKSEAGSRPSDQSGSIKSGPREPVKPEKKGRPKPTKKVASAETMSGTGSTDTESEDRQAKKLYKAKSNTAIKTKEKKTDGTPSDGKPKKNKKAGPKGDTAKAEPAGGPQ